MAQADTTPGRNPRTRIQKKNAESILEAALDVFSQHGFRGATLDQIAQEAGLSKPNLLYYFPSKVDIHRALIDRILDKWLTPYRDMDAEGDPIEEIMHYVTRKLEMSRLYPRESRLFANEIVQGAPNIGAEVNGQFTSQVDDLAALISSWVEKGKIAKVDPYHLIFSIWATTQHYADFDVQVRSLVPHENDVHFSEAKIFLDTLYRRLLTP